jgi:hypothetical protein
VELLLVVDVLEKNISSILGDGKRVRMKSEYLN